MPTVKFTTHLQRFFPGLENGIPINGRTIAEIVQTLDEQYPGFASYIVDERGALRKHVNIFIGENLIHDRAALRDAVEAGDLVFIMQALSGG